MLILCLVLVIAALLIHVSIWSVCIVSVVKKYRRLVQGINDYIPPSAPDQPSDFNQTLDQIAILFADRFRITMTAADRGAAGAAARDLNRGLEEYAAEQSPVLSLVNQMPKSLKKNKLAMAGLDFMLQKALSGQPGSGSGSGGSNGSNQMKFGL